jgi:hypothetical protein
MEQLPEFGGNYQQERKGVSRFASAIADLGLIWRETSNSDVGIDGQVEFVDTDGRATGIIVAVQIKSGESFIKGTDEAIVYYPSSKHANYWREFPVPVLLVIHDPATRTICWTDARQQLRSAPTGDVPIRVPRSQTIDKARPEEFFATVKPIEKPLSVPEIVRAMIANAHPAAGFRMSFFELFGFGITDIGRKLFFGMTLCMEIAEFRAYEADVGWGVGGAEHEFVDRYISFLVAQGLIYYDYSDYLLDRDERELAPTFLVPLTLRGRQTLEAIHTLTGGLFFETLLAVAPNSASSICQRLARSDAIQKQLATSDLCVLPEDQPE